MVVYGYKPDTFIAVYPTLQRRNAPRGNIFKNAAVYLADRLPENYYHRLKVQFVCQQSQMVQRAELVHLASPCPICRVQIIAPLLRLIETHFHNLIGKIFIFVILSQILVLKIPYKVVRIFLVITKLPVEFVKILLVRIVQQVKPPNNKPLLYLP